MEVRYSVNGFNEARANCAGNCCRRRHHQQLRLRFNEARANCAGNSCSDSHPTAPACGFNEARANCAGNCAHLAVHMGFEAASMRPAQIAREIGAISKKHDLPWQLQ